MAITLDGTNGITNDSGYTGDGVSFADSTPANTLVTTSGGNVGIGTSTPGYKLDVSYNSFDVARFVTTASNTDARVNIEGLGTGLGALNSVRNGFVFQVAGTERARIDSSGNLRVPAIYNLTTAGGANVHVSADGTLYRSTSSLKYKTNVQDATHGLDAVMQLRAVTYKGKNDGDLVFGGLIAEEVHAAGLTEFVQYAEDGTPDALAYANMVSLAFKAIQELKAEVDSLKAQINGANA